MILRPLPLSSGLFMWHSEDASFSTEASELPWAFELGRVYDDSCDEGFTMISDRTGKEVVFCMEETIKDCEGNILAWEFKSVSPGFKDKFKATIFND